MKKILVPSDFSENSTEALIYAIGIAKKEKAKIILLHTWTILYHISDIPTLSYVSEEPRAAEAYAREQLDRLCKEITELCDVPHEAIIRQGTVVDTILDIIKEKEIDLVIMGTRGATGLQEIFIGSNTAKVIRKAHCPVLAIPAGCIFNDLKKIIYATNYQTSDFNALKRIAAIARPYNAEITLLHITDEYYSPEGAEILLKAFTQKVKEKTNYYHFTFHLIYGSDVNQKLDEYVQKKHADLFVMSTMHRNILDRLLFGESKAKVMAFHTKMPLMVFHHTENTPVFI